MNKKIAFCYNRNWTELGLSFAHPAGCYSFFFNDQNGPVIHLPRLTAQDLIDYGIETYEVGNVNLYLDKHDGSGKFHAYQYLSPMYSMSDEQLKEATTDLVKTSQNCTVLVNGNVLTISSTDDISGVRYGYRANMTSELISDVSKIVSAYAKTDDHLPLNLFKFEF